jgi:hypothetical protein
MATPLAAANTMPGTAALLADCTIMRGRRRINQTWTPEEDEKLLRLADQPIAQYQRARALGALLLQ